MYPRLATIISALLMLGMVFLEFKIPILLAIATTGAVFLGRFLFTMKMDKVGFIVLLNYAYWMWSAFLTGSLSPLDLLSPDFLSGEGRIMVSYLPILFFSVVSVSDRDIESVRRLFVFVALFCFMLFLAWVPTKSAMLSEGASGHFVGFLTSHTGGGTFFGIVAVTLAIYGIEARKTGTALLGGLMLVPMLASGSREAMLAFLAMVGWYILKRREWKIATIAATFLALLILAAPFVAPEAWKRTSGLFTMDLIESIVDTAETTQWKPGDGEDELELAGTQVNVLFRIAIWTYALGRFAESPLLGIGFGRYNDYDLQFDGIPGLLYPAVEGFKVIGVSNAHNSYVHTLCEGGLVGLALLLWLWLTMYLRLRRQEKNYGVLDHVRAMAVAGQGIVIFTLVAALTGHALAAPSLGFPALIILGMMMAYGRDGITLGFRTGREPAAIRQH